MAFPPGKTAPPFGKKKDDKEKPAKGNPFAKGKKPAFPPKSK
jgi:hypothetical protein